MQLLCLSVTHHNTPVELRECLSLSPEVIEDAFSTFPVRVGPFESINEMVILSTCNRLEVYALVSLTEGSEESQDQAFQLLMAYLREVFNIPSDWAGPYFKPYAGVQAVEHLFLVAAGLDSIAIGETQILGQVSRALDGALRLGSARHVLSSLFRSAIHTGKRVRSETDLGRHRTSISAIAVQLAEDTLGGLAGLKILVVGAGKMGGATITALREAGARQIMVANRTLQRAADLASHTGEAVLPFECLADGLSEADVVFTSTAAPAPIIHRDLMAETMSGRPQKPLTMVDLAVPRNVETKVREIPGVRLFDMDDFRKYVKNSDVSRHQDLASARSIVEKEVREYEKLLHIIPFIGELHKKVELIRRREVEKTLRHLHDPDPQVKEQIEVFSRALVRKILHEPTMHLRTETNQETLNDYVDILGRLFDLSEAEPDLVPQNGGKWER